MSHAHGAVKFEDGLVLFYEYSGTGDYVCTALKRTQAEVSRDWRSPANNAKCTCGASESVELMTDYARGLSWPGKACRRCMAITDGQFPLDTDGIERVAGIPAWAQGARAADGQHN